MTKTTNLFRRSCVSTLALGVLAAGAIETVRGQELIASEARVVALATRATWVPTGNLATGRAFHTATLLANGKVLVAGGTVIVHGNQTSAASAEIYDPASGTWSVTGSMSIPRVGHTVTLLSSGMALATGGEAELLGGALGTAEIYDPATGSWSPTGNPMTARSSHTATLLQNGKVLVAGGINWSADVVRSAELFDPATGTWSPTGSPIQARFYHTATLLNDGRVLIARGATDPVWEWAVNTAELYDPVTGTWIAVESGGGATVHHTATLLPNGKVLFAGGGRSPVFVPEPGSLVLSALFDPATLSWAWTGDLGTPRYLHTATLLPTGEVLVAGGTNATFHSPPNEYSYDPVASAEMFDPSTGAWSVVGDLGAPRSGHSATLLPDGRVLVAGGGIGGPLILASAELYGSVLPGTIVPAFTGSWYDPAQSGHGVLVEVLPDNRFLAAWFAFNPAGTEQAWFVGTGTYIGNMATVAVVQPTGGRFIPNFDSARVANNPWGTLTFTFTDCNHGRVDFSSTRGYGTGSMNLTRLTQPVGLLC